jgi:hypothetical protein
MSIDISKLHLTAKITTAKTMVDGRAVSMEAYSIKGLIPSTGTIASSSGILPKRLRVPGINSK